jgi:hypothetical protein
MIPIQSFDPILSKSMTYTCSSVLPISCGFTYSDGINGGLNELLFVYEQDMGFTLGSTYQYALLRHGFSRLIRSKLSRVCGVTRARTCIFYVFKPATHLSLGQMRVVRPKLKSDKTLRPYQPTFKLSLKAMPTLYFCVFTLGPACWGQGRIHP